MSNMDRGFVGSGSVVNQVQNAYNDFAQLTQSWQVHAGTVNTGTTPQVQYSYASGSANTIRITGMTYPNGRNIVDDYGTAGSMDDASSRIRGMKDSGATANLVDYNYLGLSGFVKAVYPESSIQYTLIGTAGGTNPDSGDIYLGIDRFGRVTDAHWANTAGSTTLGRVKYGYDRVSNRTWRDNLSPGMTVGSDELYSYDQLQRLQHLNRGTLNGTQTAITSPTFGQNWTLDETGNWSGFKQDNTVAGTWNLDQSRTANTVNEIKTITNATSSAWTTPAYDAASNMTRIPVPGTLPDGVAWNSMSLSEWENLKLADWEELTLDNVEAVYDAWNRLVQLHVGATILAVYAYDARGYRIRKDSYTSGTLSEARHYYYTPGWQVVEERVGSSTSANRQFVWGLRYIDDLVLRARDTDGNGTLDERRYCLQDGNWNTIAIANTSGTVTERFSYDAYGVPTFLTSGGTVQASSPTGWETLYAGYRWDGDPSKMYYVRNRMLLPYGGIWNCRDPIGYEGQSTNLNAYSRMQPITRVDPFALCDEPIYPPSCPEIVDPAGRPISGNPYFVQVRVETRKLSISEMYQADNVDSGHTFIMLRPPEDAPLPDKFIRNHYYGYYPGDGFFASEGKVTYQDEHDYTHASPLIPVSKETYDKITAYMVSVRKDPGLYSVFDKDPNDKVHQCATFAIESLRAGNIDICPDFGNGRLIAPENLVEIYKLTPTGGVSKSTAEGGTRYNEWEKIYNQFAPRQP